MINAVKTQYACMESLFFHLTPRDLSKDSSFNWVVHALVLGEITVTFF